MEWGGGMLGRWLHGVNNIEALFFLKIRGIIFIWKIFSFCTMVARMVHL